MSFLPAVRREIDNRPPDDPTRLTLEYLIQHGIGHRNPVPLPEIVEHLNDNGIQLSETGFQQTILAESRDSDYFIGSGPRGYFLIDTVDDARVMQQFYTARINAEQQNLENLRRQARNVGWNIETE
jgi:hypothetical protein